MMQNKQVKIIYMQLDLKIYIDKQVRIIQNIYKGKFYVRIKRWRRNFYLIVRMDIILNKIYRFNFHK